MLTQTIRKPIQEPTSIAAARSGTFLHSTHLHPPHFFGLQGVEMCQAWADVCSFIMAVPIACSAFRDMRREKQETI